MVRRFFCEGGDGHKSNVSVTALKGAIITQKEAILQSHPKNQLEDFFRGHSPSIAPEAPDIEEFPGEEPLERG